MTSHASARLPAETGSRRTGHGAARRAPRGRSAPPHTTAGARARPGTRAPSCPPPRSTPTPDAPRPTLAALRRTRQESAKASEKQQGGAVLRAGKVCRRRSTRSTARRAWAPRQLRWAARPGSAQREAPQERQARHSNLRAGTQTLFTSSMRSDRAPISSVERAPDPSGRTQATCGCTREQPRARRPSPRAPQPSKRPPVAPLLVSERR